MNTIEKRHSWLSRIFFPILAGATLKERIIGCVGALFAICLTGFICTLMFGDHPQLPLIVAPVGASAVLLFAVPASPLAQPWSIIGGNTISAFVGVLVAQTIHDPMVAIGMAVSLAILAMSLTRTLHPPGGAAALTAVIGGAAINKWGLLFPFIPVGANSILLVLIGIVFHRIAGRNYPHRPLVTAVNLHKTADQPPPVRIGFNNEDIDAAIAKLNETLDISRGDLDVLLREVEMQALLRQRGEITCSDIMSRDVVTIKMDAPLEDAKRMLLDHDVRALPVLNEEGHLLGTVGLREIADAKSGSALPISKAVTAGPDDPAMQLLPKMTAGTTHVAVIVDDSRAVLGVISQTDLLAVLAKSFSRAVNAEVFTGQGHGI